MFSLLRPPGLIVATLLLQILFILPCHSGKIGYLDEFHEWFDGGNSRDGDKLETATTSTTTLAECYEEEPLYIAQVGNSMQYTNDSPRLLEFLFGGPCKLQQDSCFRSGSTIPHLWREGNGMILVFRDTDDRGAPDIETLLSNDRLDFVVINDHTQAPARASTRQESLETLRDDFVPLLKQHRITPVFIQTPAHKIPCIRETEDLGDYSSFTELVLEGTETYKKEMDAWLATGTLLNDPNPVNVTARVAPVGLAFARLHETNPDLWNKLYDPDDFHPSPHGTLLQAYVLYITMTGNDPPTSYDPQTWWSRARYMQPLFEDPLPLPTVGDSRFLRRAAIQVCRAYRAGIIKPVSKPMPVVCP